MQSKGSDHGGLLAKFGLKGHVMRERNLVAYRSCSQAGIGCSSIVWFVIEKWCPCMKGKPARIAKITSKSKEDGERSW